jgi:uncharacterized protein YlxW (UPF0749 family)
MSVFSANIRHRSFYWQISVLCFVLGLLLAAAWNTTQQLNRAGGVSARTGFYYGSGAQVAVEKAVDYQSEIRKLRLRNTELENNAAKGKNNDDTIKTINKELQDTKLLAGLTEVEGQGVEVVLSDSKKRSDFPFDQNNLIHDADINAIVNELKASGAEAIEVNGQRVVASTAIRCLGPVVSVNDVRSAPPVIIKAVGSADTLYTGLNIQDGVLDQIRRYDPAMVRMEKKKLLHLPAFTGSTTLHYARLPESQRSKEKNP